MSSKNAMTVDRLPTTGFVRPAQFLGDKKRGIPPLIPVSRTSWHDGQQKGIYPKAKRLPGQRAALYDVNEIRAVLAMIAAS